MCDIIFAEHFAHSISERNGNIKIRNRTSKITHSFGDKHTYCRLAGALYGKADSRMKNWTSWVSLRTGAALRSVLTTLQQILTTKQPTTIKNIKSLILNDFSTPVGSFLLFVPPGAHTESCNSVYVARSQNHQKGLHDLTVSTI